MSEATDTPPVDENKLIAERREKLKALRGQGIAYPNDFHREDFAGADIHHHCRRATCFAKNILGQALDAGIE